MSLAFGIPPSRLDDHLTPGDFALLRAFDGSEPIGDRRLDLLFALLQHTNVAVQLGSRKAPPAGAFVPRWWPERRYLGDSDGS